MDGIATVLGWATGSLEGIAFVELLILIALVFLWREIRHTNKRLDLHEKATSDRFGEGKTKIALLDERTKSMQDDIREIKESVKR